MEAGVLGVNIMDRENVDPSTGALAGRCGAAGSHGLTAAKLPQSGMFSVVGRRPLADVTELFRLQVGTQLRWLFAKSLSPLTLGGSDEAHNFSSQASKQSECGGSAVSQQFADSLMKVRSRNVTKVMLNSTARVLQHRRALFAWTSAS